MTRRLASGRAGLGVRAGRWLLLAFPLGLLALAAAAFALAPSSIGHWASARPGQGLFPPLPRASGPAPAIDGRFAVTGAAVSVGGHARSRPPTDTGRRWRVEP